jgi:hypothetical protein
MLDLVLIYGMESIESIEFTKYCCFAILTLSRFLHAMVCQIHPHRTDNSSLKTREFNHGVVSKYLRFLLLINVYIKLFDRNEIR